MTVDKKFESETFAKISRHGLSLSVDSEIWYFSMGAWGLYNFQTILTQNLKLETIIIGVCKK